METVRLGDRVRVVCTTRLEDGTEVEPAKLRDAPYWVRADGRRPSVLRSAVVGMSIGERKTLAVEVRPGHRLTLSIAVLGIRSAGADARLHSERLLVDEALAAERGRMDALVPGDAHVGTVATRARVARQRQVTDDHLAAGRQLTDTEVRRSATAFSDERAAHNVTRAALTTRDELLAIVSHDLRNPLGSIAMAVDLLALQPGVAGESSEVGRYFELIRRNASEALRLINDLIDMESLDRGKFRLVCATHDIYEVMRHALEMFQSAPLAKAFIFRLAPHDPLCMSFDRDRVTQVLANLIGNAIKFSPNGGVVTLTVRQLAGEIEVTVADSGPGIPERAQATIFNRFSQIQRHDRRGLGLGLHISRLLVEAHGGRIWVDSNVGCGSAFRFVLPA